jgi:hypothetical protein
MPAWSHDGARVAYTCRRGIGLGSLCFCILDRVGGFESSVFACGAAPGHASWSPDGRIAFDTVGGSVALALPQPGAREYFLRALNTMATCPHWRPRMSAIPGPGQVTIRWAHSAGATSYNLYVGTGPGVTTTSGTRIEGVVSPFLHTGLAAGNTYHYVLTALNSGRETEASPEVFATVPPPSP